MPKVMRKFSKNGWILHIFLALSCLLFSPANALFASPHPVLTDAKVLPNSSANLQNNDLHPQPRERKLSAFFKIGIALNIIVMFSFAWWATGQWRMKKRNKDT